MVWLKPTILDLFRKSISSPWIDHDYARCKEMKRFLYELTESWRIAVAQMRSNMTRSALTALGVIIGIIAVTLMGTAVTGIPSASITACLCLGTTFFTSRNGRGKGR